MKEKILLEDDGLITQNSDEKVDWVQVLGQNDDGGTSYDAYTVVLGATQRGAASIERWMMRQLQKQLHLQLVILTSKLPPKRKVSPVDPMQEASAGTTSRLQAFYKMIPTPGFKPPRKTKD
ncbi:hypothetical protein PIB30_047695 [Stylosanthes scabra]|uniref:Uncharacterized protein n=1 Tax=Stylosanthes scabra TaxID=79078 RepID=A0ABU6QG72_9FABA|nr:hypothetical protein [Stylosanthes scabra]